MRQLFPSFRRTGMMFTFLAAEDVQADPVATPIVHQLLAACERFAVEPNR